jgi:peptidylprolyl isomerase
MGAMARAATAVLLTLAALALAGCGSDSSSSGITEATKELERPRVSAPTGPPPEGLETKELVEGTGVEAEDGDELTVEFVSGLYEGGKELSSSWVKGGEPKAFELGAEEVIAGWEEGVAGMKVGGRRELIVPPDLAFGAEGAPPNIGPNETLIFILDLISVK